MIRAQVVRASLAARKIRVPFVYVSLSFTLLYKLVQCVVLWALWICEVANKHHYRGVVSYSQFSLSLQY